MRSPRTSRVPASASRRSIASTSCGTIDPPKTRAKASPTVDSSLRSKRSTRPISPPALLVVVVVCADGSARPRVAWPHGLLACYRPSAAMRDQQNSENRVEAGQRRDLGRLPAQWAPVGGIGTVGERGVARDRLPRLLGRVAEWQTRWLQVPVSFGTWGFKSPFAHRQRFSELS